MPGEFPASRLLPGSALQTIVPAIIPGPAVPGRHEPVLVEVTPGSRVRIDLNHPAGEPTATLLLIHGMCGSAESAYMRYCAAAAVGRGWLAARMNLRTCGGTERETDTLYNAGQSGDADTVLRYLAARPEHRGPLYAAGFSLGGNLLLRYVGLSGDGAAVDAVAGVNAPIDLELCLRALEEPRNRIYHFHYVRKLCSQLRRIDQLRGTDRPQPRARHVGTLRNFDDLYTAPDGGYGSSDEYYAAAHSAQFLGGIRRPTLVLSAANDPFVPVAMFARHHGLEHVAFAHPPVGGHCGYRQSRHPRCWAAEAVLDFLAQV